MKSSRPTFSSSRGAEFGGLQQVFDDVWWAWGTTRVFPGIVYPRNMTVIREGDGLVVIHPVMLPPDEQAEVEALGTVEHIVRLGDYHGMDDALYVERYAPTVWAPPGATPREGAPATAELAAGADLPLEDATLKSFDVASVPEAVLHLARHGGILLTCDSVQSWGTTPAGSSPLFAAVRRPIGFRGPACIGPMWRRFCEPRDGEGFGPRFRDILELDFRHLISAHGPPLLDTAKDELRRSVDRIYPA